MSYEIQYLIFALIGYLSGSVLYAKVWGYVFTGGDITVGTSDKNPGTFNAFANGGIICGSLTVICDLLKGIIPVYLCLHIVDQYVGNEILMALVLCAPIMGHIFPIFHKFKGGKGIAVTFGSLLGFAPDFRPALLLAIVFIVFAVIFIIKPNYYKTMVTFVLSALISPFMGYRLAIVITYIAATLLVCARLLMSDEDKKYFRVSFIKWQIISIGLPEENDSADTTESVESDEGKEQKIKQ